MFPMVLDPSQVSALKVHITDLCLWEILKHKYWDFLRNAIVVSYPWSHLETYKWIELISKLEL